MRIRDTKLFWWYGRNLLGY